MIIQVQTKHTAGPWEVVNRPYETNIVSESRVMIADIIRMEGQTYGNGQREANARLIAAAPELLEALQDVHTHFIGLAAYLETCAPDVIIDNLRTTVTALKRKEELVAAAIHKARGEF